MEVYFYDTLVALDRTENWFFFFLSFFLFFSFSVFHCFIGCFWILLKRCFMFGNSFFVPFSGLIEAVCVEELSSTTFHHCSCFFSCFLRSVIQLSKVYLHLRSLMRSLTSHQLPMLEDKGRCWLSLSLAVPVEANWTTRSFVNDGWISCCWTEMISNVLNARKICSWAGEKEGGACRNIQMLNLRNLDLLAFILKWQS